jgi:hypothetical protein
MRLSEVKGKSYKSGKNKDTMSDIFFDFHSLRKVVFRDYRFWRLGGGHSQAALHRKRSARIYRGGISNATLAGRFSCCDRTQGWASPAVDPLIGALQLSQPSVSGARHLHRLRHRRSPHRLPRQRGRHLRRRSRPRRGRRHRPRNRRHLRAPPRHLRSHRRGT